MRINFVLPRTVNRPMGGYKVVFQYAQKMRSLGNDVHIYFMVNFHRLEINYIKRIFWGIVKFEKYRRIDWFGLKGIKLHFEQSIDDIKNIKDGCIIATHWSTAMPVFKSKCKKKFYFIQGYEIFDPKATQDELDFTWKLPMKKIVVSKWLYQKSVELQVSDKTALVPNFIDTNEFPLNRKNEKRNSVSFLWHSNPDKQAEMGIRIAHNLKKKYPKLSIIMFGADIRVNDPEIKIVNNATVEQLNMIYRDSIVYFMPSAHEGWGLTGMEAMACGAAVAAIDNGGIWEYADTNTAEIVDNDITLLEKAICKLLDDDVLRQEKCRKAMERVSKMTLDNATYRFLSILSGKKEE